MPVASIGWHAAPPTSSCHRGHQPAGAGFKSIKDQWADNTTPHGPLMLTVLGGLAEFERELIGHALARAGSTRKSWLEVQAPAQGYAVPAAGSARTADGWRDARSYNVDSTTIGKLQWR